MIYYFTKKFQRFHLSLLCISLLAGCADMENRKVDLPKTRDEIEVSRVGKLTGEEGITLSSGEVFKPSDKSSKEGYHGNEKNGKGKVSNHLWKAALNQVSFMPLASVDSSSGVIITDWYNFSGEAEKRYKFNIYITGKQLKSDSLKVVAFKQAMKGNNWRDVKVNATLVADLEKEIISKARELKVNSEKRK